MPDINDTMRAIEVTGRGLDALRLVERPIPQPGPGEILLRVGAATLNYRDLAILNGTYRPEQPHPFVPGSDACGEVVALGVGVTRFKTGDRAIPTYVQGWIGGLPTPEQRMNRTLGVPLPGVLQDYVTVPAEDAVSAPEHLTDTEAATLPVAAVTAWNTLQAGGIKPGDWVLVQGTGGVALFALQFAKRAGARVLALSSSEEKLSPRPRTRGRLHDQLCHRARLGRDREGQDRRHRPGGGNHRHDPATVLEGGRVRRLHRRDRVPRRLRHHHRHSPADLPAGPDPRHRRRVTQPVRGHEPGHRGPRSAPGHG